MKLNLLKSAMLAIAVCLAGAGITRAADLLTENFDGLTLKDATSPTETAAPGVWTDVPPAGWDSDPTTTPAGTPAEFYGWTFVNKDWWVGTAGDQDRSLFTSGSGTVAVADADEYDDGTNIDTGLFNAYLITPSIDLTGVGANSVSVKFDSSFRAEVTQIGVLDVSYDGVNYSNVLTLDSAALNDGETYLTAYDLAVNNPAGGSMWLRWGLVQGSNDWWWAIDNVAVSAVPEPTTFTLASMMGLGLLSIARRRK